MPAAEAAGKLTENLLIFARLLRSVGIPIGTGSVLRASEAINLIGMNSRADLHACLQSVFITRHDQQALFDQAFELFWRNPKLMERMLAAMLPTVQSPEQNNTQLLKRLSDALQSDNKNEVELQEQEIEFDASFTYSDTEILQEKDFEQMSTEEIERAKQIIQELALPLREIKTRRFLAGGNTGPIDMRKTMQSAMRSSDTIPLQFKQPRSRLPALVVLCDISGSMSQYSRMFLHFMHAVTSDRDRVFSFVFGTRLSNITRYLAHRDVDMALAKTSQSVQDWSGGTRIGTCLAQFNQQWSRRVLSQGAITLLITDGLDRDEGAGLRQEMDRLARSSKRVVWLNPLLRYEGFQPKASGIRAMLPYVDDFVTAHNINSLAELVRLLSVDPLRKVA